MIASKNAIQSATVTTKMLATAGRGVLLGPDDERIPARQQQNAHDRLGPPVDQPFG